MELYQEFMTRALPGFFAWHWRREEDWRKRREQLNQRATEPRLLRWLEAYNRELGAAPEALTALEHLRDGAPVVVAGQQTGLLTGPLYTIYKAVTALGQAKELGILLGEPVVPIFWLASDDHDYNEIRSAWFPGGDAPRELTFPGEYLLTPAAKIRLVAEDVNYICQRLGETLPATDFTQEILQVVAEAGQEAVTYSEWCARLLCRLLSSQGLVVVDSTAPPLRWLAQPVLTLAAREGETLHHLIDSQAKKLRQAGFQPGLDIPRNHSHLFWLEGNSRTALLRVGQSFSGRRGEISFSQAELLGAIADTPEHFSPNVVLRPLVQELAFPVLAMVVGPGETAYMAQLPQIFALLGLEQPPLIPRLGGIILEPPLERILTRYNLTLEELPNLEHWLTEQLFAGEGGRIREEFSQLREILGQAWSGLDPMLTALDPQLPLLAEKNLAKVLQQVDWLEGRAQGALRKNNDQLVRHVQRLQTDLTPPGGQQRLYNIFWYINKYGMDFLQTLASLPPGEGQVIRPGRTE